MIKVEITKLIQVLTVNNKEQMEEQAIRRHKEKMDEQAIGNLGNKRRNMRNKWLF